MSGKVGIGTTGPTKKLDILGTSNAGIRLEQGAQISATSGKFYNGLTFQNLGTTHAFGIGYGTGTAFVVNYFDSATTYRNLLSANAYGDLAITRNLTVSGTGDSSIAGNVGIGTTGPTRILGIGGLVARNIGMERGTVAATAGFALTINAGGATSGATDKAGGALILQGGLSTGSAESGVTIQGCVAGASGTTDRTQTTAIQVLGNKISFYNQTPIIQQSFIAYTADNESGAYTGIDNLQVGSVYAQLTDLNALRVAYENLRVAYEDLKTKLVATTLVTTT